MCTHTRTHQGHLLTHAQDAVNVTHSGAVCGISLPPRRALVGGGASGRVTQRNRISVLFLFNFRATR